MRHNLQMPNDATPAATNAPYLTVEELSQAVKRTVETAFDYVRVRGEISQPRTPASGHIYLTLKDDRNALSAVIWKGSAQRLSVQPEEGLDVICIGKMTTFGGQSRYQLVVNDIEVAGEGALLKQLEDRRRRLAEEGLFDNARKQQIPAMPATIGVVTSPTGAVIRDILHRISERFPTHILVWGVNVQGVGSADQIAAAINGFNALPDDGPVPRPDLLIVARGGGSLEDLWSFNEEIVVRAAAASSIPLISAVGHETDTTLIDFAADLRAPTPTAAAEFATPVSAELQARLSETDARLRRAVNNRLVTAEQAMKAAERGLLHPDDHIGRLSQSVDLAVTRMDTSIYRRLDRLQLRLAAVTDRLVSPEQQVTAVAQTVSLLERRLDHSLSALIERAGNRLTQTERLLEANSYQRVLDRGFALVTDEAGKAVKTSASAPQQSRVVIRFADDERLAQLDPDAALSPPRKARTSQKQASSSATTQEELF